MGKSNPQLPRFSTHHHHQQQQQQDRCCFVNGFRRLLSFKCFFIFLLSLSVSLFAIFSLIRFHHPQSAFDASLSIKQTATVQAYFRLEKPVSFLIHQIKRLEYDINDEIGVPGTQVAILSMHGSGASNWTDVVFGVLSNHVNTPINLVSLSVLRSSLVELFTQSSNLTITKSIFGSPSSFEILKFPGGITIIPKASPPVWMLPQVLFNFTLRNSLHEIEENFLVLKEQLKSGLQLMPYESVFVQVTNKDGSTQDPPVTVQVSVVSTLGSLDPERLTDLAQEVKVSYSVKNLGLDNSVFGKVKEISLSSYLTHTLDESTPSPAPSPASMGPTISPSPSMVEPSCGGPIMSPSHHAKPPRAATSSRLPPNISPLPAVSYGSRPHQENGYQKRFAPAPYAVLESSSSYSGSGVLWHMVFPLFILITLHIV